MNLGGHRYGRVLARAVWGIGLAAADDRGATGRA